LTNYYQVKETSPEGNTSPVIIWNGNDIEDAESLQKMFVEEMPYTFYELQCLDCHVLNPQFFSPASEVQIAPEKNISVTIVVSGYLRLESHKEGPMKEFSETFVLVPNKDNASRKGPQATRRTWLIQHQVFRFVVSHEETAGLASMDME
jgi:NTF2-related export protein 1/2